VSGRPIERTVALDAGVEVGEYAIACAVVLLVHRERRREHRGRDER
jgi:hypothetical protein